MGRWLLIAWLLMIGMAGTVRADSLGDAACDLDPMCTPTATPSPTPTETPTPTITPTPTATFTPTPNLLAVWTLPPPEATDVLTGEPVKGQEAAFIYSVDAGQLITNILLFGIFVLKLVELGLSWFRGQEG
jgi:hypothetical protein